MDDEKSIYFKITRKKTGGGGWAYNPIYVIGNSGSEFFHWGVYGSADALTYGYIGTGAWDATNNLRIYSGGDVRV